MTFCLYRSNRVEKLAGALAAVVREPMDEPLARECIVVQGPGMERWLSARLATGLGVWANPWFPFPRAIVELALDAALGEIPAAEQVFRPEALSFRVAQTLPELGSDAAFTDVARYLSEDSQADALLALSSMLARTYDQYLVYRPDWVLGWERGEGDHFQAKLWRALVDKTEAPHIARRMQAFALALSRGGALDRGAARLPSRISLFGISTLPPAFLNVLTQLSTRIDVHVFLLTPSPEYWGDFDRRLARGNSVRSLLANLGKVSRDFIELLLDQSAFDEPSPELFELSGESTLLGHLQRDIADLKEREPGRGGELGPVAIDEDDRSLVVHVCHSPLRELEVLRDELRARFERDKTLEARDVVVLAPDIERYAPAIESVFSQRDTEGRAAIPFCIADRRAARASEVLEAFLALLELVSSRLLLSDVLDLLHRPPVRARFDIDENEIELLQQWLTEAGARWGADGAHRASFDQPAYEENSFRFALHRLLVGYAAADGELRSVHGVLPYSDVEGGRAELLGRLARFAETLFSAVRELAAPRPLGEWSQALIQCLARMLNDEAERGYEHQTLRSTLATLADDAQKAGFARPLGLKPVRRLLEERADRGRANFGFLSSGVTFCEHVPMRAIPFRVVCMVGMDDESFPRRAPRPSFDLTLEEERRGDRNVRDDDRQLFLEALLSARDAVVITYVGRSAKDDSARPPSVLVEQLLRVVDRHFVIAGQNRSLRLDFEHESPAESRVYTHALHRFDPRYFDERNPRYFSYDHSAAEAARALLAPAHARAPFVSGPLPQWPCEQLDLEALVSFFRAPQRVFMSERLGVRLPQESQDVPDREPTTIDALERYRLHDRLLRELTHVPPSERLRVLTQEGKLPPGTTGRVLFEALENNMRALREAVAPGEPLPDRSFSLKLPQLALTGRLTALHTQQRVEYTAAQANEKHLLGTWIRHLALCASSEAPRESCLVARASKDKCVTHIFGPVDDPIALLSDLVALYLLGMHMPLPYLRAPASAYVAEFERSRDRALALEKAAANLRAAEQPFAPRNEERYARAVFGDEQLQQLSLLKAWNGDTEVSFAEVSERVLLPMRAHLVRENG